MCIKHLQYVHSVVNHLSYMCKICGMCVTHLWYMRKMSVACLSRFVSYHGVHTRYIKSIAIVSSKPNVT